VQDKHFDEIRLCEQSTESEVRLVQTTNVFNYTQGVVRLPVGTSIFKQASKPHAETVLKGPNLFTSKTSIHCF
jgi:hypothetical protein